MSGSTAIGLSRPNSAATVAARAVLNTATKPTPPRPQSPVVEAKTSGAYNVSAIVSKGEESKGEINHYQSCNNPSSLSLGQTAMNYLKVILEQLKLKSKSQDPEKEYIATLNLAFSNNRWQNLRGQDQRELNKIPAILKTVTGNNPVINLQINTLFEQYGLVKINDQTPIIPPAPTTTQRSESSSDSSGDEKTPPNTPARPTALPKTVDTALTGLRLVKNTNLPGKLESLKMVYLGDVDVDRIYKKIIELMKALKSDLRNWSEIRSSQNINKAGTNYLKIFNEHRKFVSPINLMQKFEDDVKYVINREVQEIEKDIKEVNFILKNEFGLMDIALKKALQELITEFIEITLEIKRKV